MPGIPSPIAFALARGTTVYPQIGRSQVAFGLRLRVLGARRASRRARSHLAASTATGSC